VRLCSATGRDITLAYRSIGHESSEALVLFPGVNTNMEMYHPDFVAALAAAGPFRVLQIDMRDVGFSTKLDKSPVSHVSTFFLPRRWGVVKAPYTLEDMTDDVVALMDRLDIRAAHAFGCSMGGMLAQAFAIRHSARTLSLTSCASTTHGPSLPDPGMRTKIGFLRTPKDESDGALEELKFNWYLDFGVPPWLRGDAAYRDYFRTLSRRQVQRSRDDGFMRQMAAIIVAPPREAALAALRCPSLVIHGAKDVVVLPPHGYRTAACMTGAALLVLRDMGHCFGPRDTDLVCRAVADLAGRARLSRNQHFSH
jgi:pimeloyl-ACP methyl ester carboxylesterase